MGKQFSTLIEEPALACRCPDAAMNQLALATNDAARRQHGANEVDLDFERRERLAGSQACMNAMRHGAIQHRCRPATLDPSHGIETTCRRSSRKDEPALHDFDEIGIHRVGVERTWMRQVQQAARESHDIHCPDVGTLK